MKSIHDSKTNIDLFVNNTQFTYDQERFSIPEGSYYYDTYRYYQALSDYFNMQINIVEDIENLLNDKISFEENNDAVNYSKLHVAKNYWNLLLDEARLIEARDRLTITRALYQY